MTAEAKDLRSEFGGLILEQAARAAAELDASDRRRRALRVNVAPQWHVGHVTSASRASDRLKEARIEFYYPQVREFRRVPKKRQSHAQRNRPPVMEEHLRPLFKNYFFLYFDIRDGAWHEAFELAGISAILASDGGNDLRPAVINETEIAKIKAREVDGAIPGHASAREIIPFAVGDEVKIDDEGAFHGVHARVMSVPDGPVEALDERVRLKLLVALLGRQTVVELPVNHISRL